MSAVALRIAITEPSQSIGPANEFSASAGNSSSSPCSSQRAAWVIRGNSLTVTEPAVTHPSLLSELARENIIETVGGHANTIEQATAACRPDGRIVVLGLFSENPTLDMRTLIHKELKIMGSAFFGTSEHGPEFRASTKILPHFKDELSVLQTHQFPLSRVADAFEAAVSKDDRPIKVTIIPGS